MSIFKKFNPQDISVSPFETHKSFIISDTVGSTSSSLVNLYTAKYTSQSSNNFASDVNDNINSKKWFQLNHLYYKNFPIDRNLWKNVKIETINENWQNVTVNGHILGWSNHFGTPVYGTTERELYESVNIISIPSAIYGKKIKPKTFKLSGSFNNESLSKTIIDDGNENLYDVKWDSSSYNFIDNYNYRALYIAATDGYKYYNSSSISQERQSDDSLRFNEYRTHNVGYSPGILGSKINFNSNNNSYIEIFHNENFQFNNDNDFNISFSFTPNSNDLNRKQWILIKSFAEDYIPSTVNNEFSFEAKQREFHAQYPFSVYLYSSSIWFERTDGVRKLILSSSIDANKFHFNLAKSGNLFTLYTDGITQVSQSFTTNEISQNKSNILIGTMDKNQHWLSGSLEHLQIHDIGFNGKNVKSISESINNSKNIGNIFYEHGIATITNPRYQSILSQSTSISHSFSLQYSASHTIYEHEYVCTVDPNEFLFTNNITLRKIRDRETAQMADFATGSSFRPYVSTIGLYNDEGECLAVGKLAQPIKMPNKIDTNFIIKFDQ